MRTKKFQIHGICKFRTICNKWNVMKIQLYVHRGREKMNRVAEHQVIYYILSLNMYYMFVPNITINDQ